MVTKTLTITEEAYKMLAANKLKDESFSEEIKRIMSNKNAKTLGEFSGIISEEEGVAMLEDLEKIRKKNIRIMEERL